MRQVLYISESTVSMSDDDLQELLEVCRKNNKEHHITGVLIYIYNRFIQCVEGEPNEIEQLITNVRKDKRNKYFILLRDMEIIDRTFVDWSMGFINYENDKKILKKEYFEISSLKDLEHIEYLDKQIFSLMSGFYKSY